MFYQIEGVVLLGDSFFWVSSLSFTMELNLSFMKKAKEHLLFMGMLTSDKLTSHSESVDVLNKLTLKKEIL